MLRGRCTEVAKVEGYKCTLQGYPEHPTERRRSHTADRSDNCCLLNLAWRRRTATSRVAIWLRWV